MVAFISSASFVLLFFAGIAVMFGGTYWWSQNRKFSIDQPTQRQRRKN